MKKRILFCTEASFLPTGFSVYAREVISRIFNSGEFEVAELAAYASPDMSQVKHIPWKFYPNIPSESSGEMENYRAYPPNQHGEYSFNAVCLDFRPDVIFCYRDPYYDMFVLNSPFREHYKIVQMPTIDSEPQPTEWMTMFSEVDSVLTYSEFGRDTILKQNPKIKFNGVASPCASPDFKPLDKLAIRKEMGVGDAFVVGTVMRNQRRKLYPDLFNAFRQFMDRVDDNVLLYCHTGFPDVGWEFPELLQKYGLTNKVLFTYQCKHCGSIECHFFQDAKKFCKKCHTFNSGLCGTNNGLNDEQLNKIYNLFDVYIQYANSEGFGMPQLEAAQTNCAVLAINYSAMSSIIKNIGGIPLEPKALYIELETGCYRAVPDNAKTSDKLVDLYKNREKTIEQGKIIGAKCREFYNWDKTAKVVADSFSLDISDNRPWNSPSEIIVPATQIPEGSMIDRLNFLFAKVLGKPEWIGGHFWTKILKDLTYEASKPVVSAMRFSDHSHEDARANFEHFDINKAHKILTDLRHMFNKWEQLRCR